MKLKDIIRNKLLEENKLLLDTWFDNKSINPYTKRKIKENGNTYKILKREYNKLNNINQENNRQTGGRQARQDGYEFEKKSNTILKHNKEIIEKILGKGIKNYETFLVSDLCKDFEKIKEKSIFKDFFDKYGKPCDDKRAADIVIIYYDVNNNIKNIGIDTKKPYSNPQGFSKSLKLLKKNKILNEEEIKKLKEYFKYNESKERTYIHTEENQKIIFEIINKLKKN